jgi:hypothetical protein
MQEKFIASLVIAIVLLIAISTIAFAGSQPQPVSPLVNGPQIVTMTPGYGMMSGTPQPGTNGMGMGGSGCAMMGMTGMNGAAGMSNMPGMSGMPGSSAMSGGMAMSGTGTMNMASLDDQVILSDPATWLNNPWTLLGWLLVLAAMLAILGGIVLGTLWIVRRSTSTKPSV